MFPEKRRKMRELITREFAAATTMKSAAAANSRGWRGLWSCEAQAERIPNRRLDRATGPPDEQHILHSVVHHQVANTSQSERCRSAPNDDDSRRNRNELEDNPFIAFRRFADSQVARQSQSSSWISSERWSCIICKVSFSPLPFPHFAYVLNGPAPFLKIYFIFLKNRVLFWHTWWQVFRTLNPFGPFSTFWFYLFIYYFYYFFIFYYFFFPPCSLTFL